MLIFGARRRSFEFLQSQVRTLKEAEVAMFFGWLLKKRTRAWDTVGALLVVHDYSKNNQSWFIHRDPCISIYIYNYGNPFADPSFVLFDTRLKSVQALRFFPLLGFQHVDGHHFGRDWFPQWYRPWWTLEVSVKGKKHKRWGKDMDRKYIYMEISMCINTLFIVDVSGCFGSFVECVYCMWRLCHTV